MTSSGVVVRAAVADDVPAVLALYEQLADNRATARPATSGMALEVLEAIEAQAGRTLLVASCDGRVRGSADILVAPNLTHGGKPWMIVENVVVDCASRRQGVGRALMTEVVRRAEAAGCYKVQFLSRKGRDEAHVFYRSCGFEPVAEGFRRYLE